MYSRVLKMAQVLFPEQLSAHITACGSLVYRMDVLDFSSCLDPYIQYSGFTRALLVALQTVAHCRS